MTAYLLERAWLRDRFRDDVLVEVEDGRFTSVTPGADPQRAIPVRGLVVPGLAKLRSVPYQPYFQSPAIGIRVKLHPQDPIADRERLVRTLLARRQ